MTDFEEIKQPHEKYVKESERQARCAPIHGQDKAGKDHCIHK